MSTLNIQLLCIRSIFFPELAIFASRPGAIIYLHWLELPMARTIFHGYKGVRAIEVRLYVKWIELCIRGRNVSRLRTVVVGTWHPVSSPMSQGKTLPTCASDEEFSVRLRTIWILGYAQSAMRRLLSDCVDTHVYMSLRWAYMKSSSKCYTLAQKTADSNRMSRKKNKTKQKKKKKKKKIMACSCKQIFSL